MRSLKSILESLLGTDFEEKFDKKIGEFTLRLISIISGRRFNRGASAFFNDEPHEMTMPIRDILVDLTAKGHALIGKDEANEAKQHKKPVTVLKVIMHKKTGIPEHIQMLNPSEGCMVNIYPERDRLIVLYYDRATPDMPWPSMQQSKRTHKEMFFMLPRQDLGLITQYCK